MEEDENYYLAPIDEAGAAFSWRKMAAILGDRKRPSAETAYVTATFCDDVLNAGWDASFLDRAASAWRAAGERFVPTFGQLAKVASEEKIQSGRYYLQALRRVIDPPRMSLNIEVEAPKPRDEGMTVEQTIEHIGVMEAQRASGVVDRTGRDAREWGRIDELFLRGLHARRDAFGEVS